jgi:regulator of sigma E protease
MQERNRFMIIVSILSFVVIFSLMVFVHEFGHFIVAKKAGVRVREFGFGYPLGAEKPPSERSLCWKIGQDRDGTVYTVNLIPFGGFVNLGENDPDDKRSLASYPKRIRFAALIAGPAMNLLLAFLIFSVAGLVGYPRFLYGVGITSVMEGSPAQAAGIQSGDILLRAGELDLDQFTSDGDKATDMVSGLVAHVSGRAGQEITVVVQRGVGDDAKELTFRLTPQADENGEGKMGVGIRAAPVRIERVRAPFLDALAYGAGEILYTIQMTAMIPVQVLRGLIPASAARSVGPVGIAVLTGNAVQESLEVDWAYPILQLTAVLNVAIAITNLLPLPALDGGRIFFILLEAIRGKPLPPEKEGLVHGIGLVILLLVLVVITIQDIFVPLPQGINWSDYLN